VINLENPQWGDKVGRKSPMGRKSGEKIPNGEKKWGEKVGRKSGRCLSLFNIDA
jgi:hypothetical protein